jgi:hypothetical protein
MWPRFFALALVCHCHGDRSTVMAAAVLGWDRCKNPGKKKPAGKSGLNPIPCRSWRRQMHYAALPQNLPILILYTGYF